MCPRGLAGQPRGFALVAAALTLDPPPATHFEVEGLTVRHGARRLLDRVSLAISARRVTALVGAPGCGKTAFLRALNRMNDPLPGVRTEGSVRFEGRELNADGVDVQTLRRRVGMVFRAPQLFPGTIFDNLVWGLRAAGERRPAVLAERAARALARADLADELGGALEQPARALPPGQQQRLCLARALALDPAALLLDEPAAGLDPIATARLEDAVAALRDSVTVVIVTHAVAQAARVSQVTAFFSEGRLVEAGETSAVFTTPREAATRDYLTGRYG